MSDELKKGSCGQCKFYVEEPSMDLSVKKGHCERFPPQMTHLPTQTGQIMQMVGFPIVNEKIGCWEFEQKPATLVVN